MGKSPSTLKWLEKGKGSGEMSGGLSHGRLSWNWMARKRNRGLCVLLLVIVALGAFFPALAPLPPLPSSASRVHDPHVKARTFKIASDMFWKDNHPFQIIGGDLHYFRVLPEYWEDRLLRAKALGLNTIQTYVPWNLHERQPRKWIFEGVVDIESFLKLAQELGFLVMLRPGPYICAEWDLGGFPAWLLSIEPALKLRSSDPVFLHLVERWWDILFPRMIPFLYENGGPIIMVQIENEYGSYGDDKSYLRHLVALARRHLGEDIILYTTDGGARETLSRGTLPEADVFSAVDFSTGEDAWPIFELQKEFNAPGRSPPLSAEFYTGWLTHWGERIAMTDADSTAEALDGILSRNGSAVLYMAHGGTNFGFYSGANTGENDSEYKPDLTSYDYDAPISESGDVDNLKFKALRGVIERYSMVSLPTIPPNNAKRRYGHVKVQKIASLLEVVDSISDPMEVVEAEEPIEMESLGQMYGFLLYVSAYPAKENISILSIAKVHDRAQVFISCGSVDNGGSPTYVGVFERWSNMELTLPNIKCSSNIHLFILVENMGHLNYGQYIFDRKGILSSVILDGTVLHQWKMFPISFDNLSKLATVDPILQVANYKEIRSDEPAIYRGHLVIDSIDQVKDTFISFSGWNKGVAFVNNFNIGRFWPSVGPQCNLYVPAPILRQGENIVVILELNAPNPELLVNFVEGPDFTCGLKSHQL